jgi:hypothetical protein
MFESLTPAVTAYEALADLPPIQQGEDGSQKDYLHEPSSLYQQLMRSKISPVQYFESLAQRATIPL